VVHERLRRRFVSPPRVRTIRSGPPALSVLALPGMDERVNAVEFFVHHEDVRRGAPGWEPRELGSGESDMLWHRLRMARVMLRKAAGGVGVAPDDLGRDDIDTGADGASYRITARNATPAVTVVGSP